MLTKSEVETLLEQNYNQHTRTATKEERTLLKNYLAQHVDGEMNEMLAQFDALVIDVHEEGENLLAFTWRMKRLDIDALSDTYFAKLAKK